MGNTNQLNDKGQKTGLWVSLDDEGNKIYEGIFMEGHPIDTLKRYYPDGILKALMVYDSSGTKVDARIFDEEGRVRAAGKYVNQQKEGRWRFFGTRKNVLFEINYSADRLDGQGIRYFSSGAVMEKTSWADNLPDGLQEVFAPDGQKISEYYYKEGKLEGKYIVYHPGGLVAVIGYYENNLKEGNWVYYLENGEEDYTLKYSQGKLTNSEVLDERQQKVFEQYENNRNRIEDPFMYLTDPESYFKK